MNAKRIKLSGRIRQAVKTFGLPRARICERIGLDQAVLSRFMAGKSGLSMKNLDALADVLGLDVVAKRPGRKPKKGR